MTTYLARLPFRAALEFEGPDTRSFLQGQTTCDLNQLSETRSLVGAYCNPQGRMVCDFRLLQRDSERMLMVLEASCLPAARDTFTKYILFSRSELRAADEWCHFALWGERAAEIAAADSATANMAWRRGQQHWVASEVADVFEVSLPAAEAEAFESSLPGVEVVHGEAFQLQEIRAGIGHVTGSTSGAFLPQMLNYQAVDRISFSKGCYTGQEVVARMHYRGQVKRPMVLASTEYAGAISPGDGLFAAGSDKNIGQVVNCARDDDGCAWMLASVTRDAAETGAELAGNALSFHALPYSLDTG